MPLSDPWIASLRPKPAAALRLFCFPYAGGGASIFRGWAAALPPAVEVYPVQLPGRENRLRERPFTQISPLVEALADALRPYLDRPFAFWGHSMGALISLELARQLRREKGPDPVHLFVSAYSAPQIPPDSAIHRLPEAAFVEELRRLKGTPEAVLQHAELMQLMLPLLRADFALVETYGYVHEDPLDCPISAFGGLEDDGVSYDDLMAWREQTRSAFKLRMFPGDHFFLHANRAQLLQVVSQGIVPHLP